MSNTTVLTVEANEIPFEITLQRQGADINLLNAQVWLYITDPRTGDQTNAGHEECTIIDGTNGVISYSPEAGDFPTEGRFFGEAKVTFNGTLDERMTSLVTIISREKTTA